MRHKSWRNVPKIERDLQRMVIDALEQTEAEERNQECDRHERPGRDCAYSVVCLSSKQSQTHRDQCRRESADQRGMQSPGGVIDVRAVHMVDRSHRADSN
jgi:hypothetical protein